MRPRPVELPDVSDDEVYRKLLEAAQHDINESRRSKP